MHLRQVDPNSLSLVLRRLRQVRSSAVQAKVTSMRTNGQLSALVVAEHEGQLVLIDGFARQAAAVQLGMAQVTVEVLVLTPVQMKAQMYLRNHKRGLLLIEECRLVQELCEQEGLSQVDVGALLDRHKSWVSRRLSMYKALSVRLVQQGVIDPLDPGTLRKLSLLPARNQEELMAISQHEGLGSQDTKRLLELWRRAPDMQAKRYVMEQPREALQLSRAGKSNTDPRLGPTGTKVYEMLMVMRQAALRIGRQTKQSSGVMGEQGAKLLEQLREKTQRDCLWALGQVRQWSGLQSPP
ncbi:MAG: ParB-like nuclease domain protein [Deltaproteobacteria bacterium ADurb.Bin207]|mgnify:CR=1 FL=1|nr:MAG: ParB-like nuclease domain protein [Deltaproteobacteria bacterium ADurb.Bin207]